MAVVMGIDPGIEHCGWSLLDTHTRRIVDGGTDSPEQLLERLRAWFVVWGVGYRPEISTVVLEEWRQYDAVSRSGSDMPESRLIGRIEEICFTSGRELVMSATRIKQHGFAYAEKLQWEMDVVWGRTPDGFDFGYRVKRTQHEKDALAHLAWYLRQLDYGKHPTVR